MTPKQIITLVVGILALGVTAWKGPSAWAAISTGIAAVALLVATLHIVPKKDEEYIEDLEGALAKQQIANNLAADTGPSANVANAVKERSRARFMRRVQTPGAP